MSRNQPVSPAPNTPAESIVRPIEAIYIGENPIGLNKLLIMFPRLKYSPKKLEKEIVSRSRLLLQHTSLKPSKRRRLSSG